MRYHCIQTLSTFPGYQKGDPVAGDGGLAADMLPIARFIQIRLARPAIRLGISLLFYHS